MMLALRSSRATGMRSALGRVSTPVSAKPLWGLSLSRLSSSEGAQSPPEVVQSVVVAQNAPYEFQVVKDQRYSWCTCGRSAKQPLCDGAHKGTGLKPLRMVAEQDETLFLCGCKHTSSPPHCDGTHVKNAGW